MSQAITGSASLACLWVFSTIAFIFLSIRLWVRVRVSRVGILSEDIMLICSQILFFILVSAITYNISKGLMDRANSYATSITASIRGGPTIEVIVLKIIYMVTFPYYLSIWLIKGSILRFYYRLVPTKTKTRMMLHFTTVLTALCLVVVLLLNMLACMPLERNWTLPIDPAHAHAICYAASTNGTYYFSVVSNFFTDALIFVIPFSLIPALKSMPRLQLVGLISTFSLGLVTLILLIIRAVLIRVDRQFALVAIMSAVEFCTSMVVACMPALKVLVKSNKTLHREKRESDIGSHNIYVDSPDLEDGEHSRSTSGMTEVDIVKHIDYEDSINDLKRADTHERNLSLTTFTSTNKLHPSPHMRVDSFIELRPLSRGAASISSTDSDSDIPDLEDTTSFTDYNASSYHGGDYTNSTYEGLGRSNSTATSRRGKLNTKHSSSSTSPIISTPSSNSMLRSPSTLRSSSAPSPNSLLRSPSTPSSMQRFGDPSRLPALPSLPPSDGHLPPQPQSQILRDQIQELQWQQKVLRDHELQLQSLQAQHNSSSVLDKPIQEQPETATTNNAVSSPVDVLTPLNRVEKFDGTPF